MLSSIKNELLKIFTDRSLKKDVTDNNKKRMGFGILIDQTKHTTSFKINGRFLVIPFVNTAELAAIVVATFILPNKLHAKIFTDSELTINYLKRTKTMFFSLKKTSKLKHLTNPALTTVFFQLLKQKGLHIKITKVDHKDLKITLLLTNW